MGANLAGNKDYEEIIAHVGLKGKENRLPAELSGGERQRVSLARSCEKTENLVLRWTDGSSGRSNRKKDIKIFNR